MIDAQQRIDRFYTNLAGSENDLNHVLSTFVDSEHEITNFCHSHYVDMSEIQSIFQNSQNEFLILTLNIQSVNAKFDNLFSVIDNLSSQGLYFGAICLQEAWTSSYSDSSLLILIEHLYFVISDKVCNKSTHKNITSNITIIIFNKKNKICHNVDLKQSFYKRVKKMPQRR